MHLYSNSCFQPLSYPSLATPACAHSSRPQTLVAAQSVESTTPNNVLPMHFALADSVVESQLALRSVTPHRCSAAVACWAMRCCARPDMQSTRLVPANTLVVTNPTLAHPLVVFSLHYDHSSFGSPSSSDSISPLSVTFVTHSGVNLSGTNIKYCHSASRKRAA